MKNILLKTASTSIANAVEPDKVKLPDYIGSKTEDPTQYDFDKALSLVNDIIAIAFNVIIILGVFFIIYSAFLYVTSFGDDSKAETAKKTLLWSIIGTIVAFLAKTLVNSLDRLLGNL